MTNYCYSTCSRLTTEGAVLTTYIYLHGSRLTAEGAVLTTYEGGNLKLPKGIVKTDAKNDKIPTIWDVRIGWNAGGWRV